MRRLLLLCTVLCGPASATPGAWSVPGSFIVVSASPTAVSGTRGAAGTVITNTTTVTPATGTGPYTHAWTVPTSTIGVTIGSPSSATSSFSATLLASCETETGTAVDTVTDSHGATGSVAVGLTFTTTAGC